MKKNLWSKLYIKRKTNKKILTFIVFDLNTVRIPLWYLLTYCFNSLWSSYAGVPILTFKINMDLKSVNALFKKCLYETLCAIYYHLYNLKIVKNTHGRVLILEKLQAKSNTPPRESYSCFSKCANSTKALNTSVHYSIYNSIPLDEFE